MPDYEAPGLVEKASTTQHFTPPTPRERRSQAVQRLQLGLFGLAAMLLIVALANIIMDRARLADSAQSAGLVPVSSRVASSTSDPLADIGVVPAPNVAASNHAPAPRATPQH